MSKRARGGRSGTKLKISSCIPVACVMNCADNTGAKNLYVVAVTMTGARLNRLPRGSVGELFLASVKRGEVSQNSERRSCPPSSSAKRSPSDAERATSSTSKVSYTICNSGCEQHAELTYALFYRQRWSHRQR